LTPGDFRDIQADTHSRPLVTFVREVINLAGAPSASTEPAAPTAPTAPTEAKWGETLKLFSGWEGRMDSDSRPALLAAVMRDRFRQRIVAAALGAELAKEYRWSNVSSMIDRIITERPNDWLPKEFKDYLALLRVCEKEARETITQKLGADESQWTWGRYQPVRLSHLLAAIPLFGQQFVIAPFPQNGSGSSVNVGSFVSMRLIALPGHWDATRQGISLGVSGDPSSPHFRDQLEDWRAVTPREFPFTKAAVEKAARETITLVPVK
jgi:penicillin amidase